MADEESTDVDESGSETAAAGGKKKLIIFVLLTLVLVGISVGGTLYFLGFFDPPAPEPGTEEAAAQETAEAAPQPAMYFPIKPAFVVNFQSRGRQRFLQTDVTVMTRDQRVFTALQSNLPLVKNRLVMILSGELYEELQTDEGKELLRQKAHEGLQQIILEEIGAEDGVEQVLFTNFVMQ